MTTAAGDAAPGRPMRLPDTLARFVRRGGLGRSMAHVGGATALSQLIGLAVLPLVSRHLGQVAFGQFGLFFTLATTLGAAGALGLPEALLAARRWREAMALLAAALRAVLLMGLVCAAITFVLVRTDSFGLGRLPGWTFLVMAPVIWLISLAMVLQLWLVRRRRFKSLASAYVSQGALRGGTQVAASMAAPALGWLVLLGAEIVGRLSTVLVMGAPARLAIAAAIRIDRRRWWSAVVRYWRFPVFRTPSMLANNLAAGLPLFLLASAFAARDIGNFTFMMAIVVGPVGFMQRAVGDVFLGEFSARYRRGGREARSLLLKTAAALMCIAAPVALALMFLGPILFGFVFGQSWRGAGVLAAAYAPIFLGNLVVAPLGGALNVTGRPGYKLAVDLSGIAALTLSFGISRALGFDVTHTTSAFAVASLCAYSLYFLLILRAVGNVGGASAVHPLVTADRPGDPAA